MIIGITGVKQSGKDTIAKYLSDKYNFTIQRFAWKLKEITACLAGIEPRVLEDNDIKENCIVPDYMRPFIPKEAGFPSFRKFLQYFGTEVMRKISPDIWVDSLFYCTYTSHLVIPDVRYLNEAKAIKDREGIIIRVIRTSTENSSDQHKSEKELAEIEADFTIENNSTIEELYNKLDKELETYLKK